MILYDIAVEPFDIYNSRNVYAGTVQENLLLASDGERCGKAEKTGTVYTLYNDKGKMLGTADPDRQRQITLSHRQVFKAYVRSAPLSFLIVVLALLTLFGPFGANLFNLYSIPDRSLLALRFYALLSLVLTFVFSFRMAGWSKPFLLATLICGFFLAVWNQIQRQTLIFSFYDLVTGVLMLLFLSLSPSVIGVYISHYLQMCRRKKYRLNEKSVS